MNENIRALIIEDDPSWQEILTEMLQDAGLTVDVTDNLPDAVDHIRQTAHRLAIVDLSLGGSDHHNQDGLQILDAVRRHDPNCVTIMLTGYATVEIAVSVLSDHGAYTCLRKESFQRAAFRKIVQEALISASQAANAAIEKAHQEQKSTAPDSSKTETDQQQTKQAVIVDDDAGWRSILAELLLEAGYEVRQCSGYGEALGCLGREHYNLAIIDLSLSGQVSALPSTRSKEETEALDGYRLLSTTRSYGIPTIVVSGIVNPDQIEQTYRQFDIFAFLEKQNFERRAFLQTVQEAAAAAHPTDELACLTERERQVLDLLTEGLTNKEIADTLIITPNTVKRHLKSIFEKLEVHTRAAAVAKAVK